MEIQTDGAGGFLFRAGQPRDAREAFEAAQKASNGAEMIGYLCLAIAYQQGQIDDLERLVVDGKDRPARGRVTERVNRLRAQRGEL